MIRFSQGGKVFRHVFWQGGEIALLRRALEKGAAQSGSGWLFFVDRRGLISSVSSECIGQDSASFQRGAQVFDGEDIIRQGEIRDGDLPRFGVMEKSLRPRSGIGAAHVEQSPHFLGELRGLVI